MDAQSTVSNGTLPKGTMDVDDFLAHKFTHLIIGGGTAGLTVATRLSENPKLIVGVLEAGLAAFDEPRINIPGRFGETLGTDYDWKFETEPQPQLNGRTLPWARGKVLGGSSALNFMTWNRGCKEDYDAWEELGNKGWGWDSLLPFFKKSENFHPSNSEHQAQHYSYFDAPYHGTEGPLQTSFSPTYGKTHSMWHDTMNKLGLATNKSHFSGSNVGCWTSLTSVKPDVAQRSYSATAYYRPNRDRANLVLLTEAMVREIIIVESESVSGKWVAKGVRFQHGGKEHVVHTEGEVIVSAGSIQSPQLLELSGIGLSHVLNAAGIKVKVDSPVGENLQDHPMTMMIFEIDPSIVTNEDLRSDLTLAEAADQEYTLRQSGPRTCVPCSVGYYPFSHVIPSSTLESFAATLSSKSSASTPRDVIKRRRLEIDQHLGQLEVDFDVSNYSPYFKSKEGVKYATMMTMLQYPFSKGSIHIAPTNGGKPPTSDDHPIINPRFYEGPGGNIDLRTMVAAAKFANQVCTTRPLADIIGTRVYPPAVADGQEDEDYEAWTRDCSVMDWHPVGTCAMGGKEGRAGGVVDDRLRVYGVKGLRVADASIMPLQISAHLQATVYAIGEKAASMILEDWESEVQF